MKEKAMVGTTPRSFRLPLLAALAVVTAMTGCGDKNAAQEAADSDRYIKRAETYRQQRQYRAAMIEAQNARQQAPQDANASLQIATILLDLGQGRIAIEILEPFASSSDPRIALALTEAHLLQHKYESALRHLDEARSRLPLDGNARATRFRGESLLGLRRYDEAALELHRAENSAEEGLKAKLALVRLDFQRGNKDVARQQLQQLLDANPESIPVLTLAATVAERDKDLERAEELLTRAMMQLPDADVLTPEKTQVLRNLADILTRLGRTAEAMVYSKSLNSGNPEGAALQEKFNQGFEHFQKGELEEAESLLREVYDKSRNELAGTLLGLIKYARQDLAGAAEYLGSNVDPEVASDEVLLALASTQLRLDQPTKLLEMIDPAQSSRLENPELKALVGVALLETGNLTRGEQLINEARAQAPDSRPITALLARHYLSRQIPQKAIEVLNKSLQQGDDRTLRQLLISAYLAAGQRDQAIAAAQKMVDADSSNAQNQLTLGRTALASQRFDIARSALQRALDIDHSLTAAKLHLAQIDLLERKPDQAAASYRALITENSGNIAAIKGLISAQELLGDKPAEGDNDLEELVLAASDTPTARAVLVEYYVRNQRLADAKRMLPSAQGATPRYLQSVQQLYAAVAAGAALATRDYDSARTTLLEGLATNPDDRQLTALLATTEIRASQFKEAEKIIAQLESTRGAIPLTVELKGDLQAANDQPAKAVELYRTIWQQQPSDPIASKLYGQLQRTDAKAAAAFLSEWQRQLPDSLQPIMLTAMQLQSQGKNAEAAASYEQLLKRSPDNIVAMNNLALLYGSEDKRALPMAEKAARLAPESAAVLDTYGWLLLQTGDAKGAVEVLQKANTLAPQIKEIATHLEEAKAKL